MGERVYAIGDLHGYADLLRIALREIGERCHSGATIIFLGDYIDRGPDSKDVLDILMAGPQREGDRWICLKGNHEDMMCQVHRERQHWHWWIGNGGETALKSWGGTVPQAALDWCDALPIAHETEHHFFVHAGVHPGVPLAKQKPEHMLWIRDLFLNCPADFGKHIVHGHTPNERADLRPNRTNLDSGSFFSGRIAVGRFDLSKPGGPDSVFYVGKP